MATPHQPTVQRTPLIWIQTCAGIAVEQAARGIAAHRADGEHAGEQAPTMPPTPCTPNTSRESS